MYRVDDFTCFTPNCTEFKQSVERFEEVGATPLCHKCNNGMERLIGAPMGIVRNTRNPVTYVKKK